MCGIIFGRDISTNAKPINGEIINQYEEQYLRGQKGFGIINILPDNTFKVDRATEPVKFMLDLRDNVSQCLLVHHRTPTSTDNKLRQTHPIAVDNGSLKYKYLMVHNGIIRNDDEVKLVHEALGFCYGTEDKDELKFNDSESLAIELARYIEKQTGELDILGSLAFIMLQISRKSGKVIKVYFGRKTSPLNMAKTRSKIFLSSEGKGDPIQEEILYSFKLDENMKLIKERLVIKTEPVTVLPAVSSSTAGVSSYYSDHGRHFQTDEDYGRDYRTIKGTKDDEELSDPTRDPDIEVMHDLIDDFAETCYMLEEEDANLWIQQMASEMRNFSTELRKAKWKDSLQHIDNRLDI